MKTDRINMVAPLSRQNQEKRRMGKGRCRAHQMGLWHDVYDGHAVHDGHALLCPSYVKTTLRMKMGENGSLKGNQKTLILFTGIGFSPA